MTQTRAGCAGLIILGFGFVALMALTGASAGIDSVRARTFAWLVEDVIVGSLGRVGGAVTVAGLGIALALAVYAVGDGKDK